MSNRDKRVLAQPKPTVHTTPGNNIITTGDLVIPLSVDRKNGDIENEYREYLWPKCIPGYSRLSRELVWIDKIKLRYKIIDVPQHLTQKPTRRAAEHVEKEKAKALARIK